MNHTPVAVLACALCASILAGCTSSGPPGGSSCTPEEKRCAGNDIETCSSDGTAWIYYRSCEEDQRCAAGACVELPASCGNETCEPTKGESCNTCPADCGSCCGNGQCEPAFGESPQLCPRDCPAGADAGGDGPAADLPQASGAPQILSLLTNVTSLIEGEAVIVTAVVTDPDGIDDLIGGTLTALDQASYGAFTTTAQEGSYQATISWAAMNQIMPISFAYGQTEQRSLVATFFDQQGHSASATVAITLSCAGLAACAGKCIDTMTDSDNCGSCEHACPGNIYAQNGCYLGECAELGPCEDRAVDITCAARCAAKGKVCQDLCARTSSTSLKGAIIYLDLSCTNESVDAYSCSDTVPHSSSSALRCCCF